MPKGISESSTRLEALRMDSAADCRDALVELRRFRGREADGEDMTGNEWQAVW